MRTSSATAQRTSARSASTSPEISGGRRRALTIPADIKYPTRLCPPYPASSAVEPERECESRGPRRRLRDCHGYRRSGLNWRSRGVHLKPGILLVWLSTREVDWRLSDCSSDLRNHHRAAVFGTDNTRRSLTSISSPLGSWGKVVGLRRVTRRTSLLVFGGIDPRDGLNSSPHFNLRRRTA